MTDGWRGITRYCMPLVVIDRPSAHAWLGAGREVNPRVLRAMEQRYVLLV